MENEFYLQARREWDERYGDLVLGKRNWQITSAGLMLLSLILALGIVWMSARTKVIPFVVEVDKLGYAITIPTARTASNTPATIERMKRYEIAAFIRDARFVSSDPAVEQNMLNDLLAHAHVAANKFLESYFHADDFAKNPFQLMNHQTVSVQIESILQASPKSYEVRWSETALDMSGAPLGTSHWEAILETEISSELNRHRHQQSAGVLCNAAQLGRAAKLRSTKMNRLTIIAALLFAASALNACAAKQPAPPPPLEIVPQYAPEAEATPTPPRAEALCG